MANLNAIELLRGITPGPWYLDQRAFARDGYVPISSKTNKDWIGFAEVVVRMQDAGFDKPEGVANANLIAAAPELASMVVQLEGELQREKDLPYDLLRTQHAELLTCLDELMILVVKDEIEDEDLLNRCEAILTAAKKAKGLPCNDKSR